MGTEGATWEGVRAVGGSIAPGSFGIRALAVDLHDPRRLLAGTAKRGIFTFTERRTCVAGRV